MGRTQKGGREEIAAGSFSNLDFSHQREPSQRRLALIVLRPLLRSRLLLSLPNPRRGRDLIPSLLDPGQFSLTEQTGLDHFRVLTPALRFGCADNSRVHSRNTEREAQGMRNCFLQRKMSDEFVIER